MAGGHRIEKGRYGLAMLNFLWFDKSLLIAEAGILSGINQSGSRGIPWRWSERAREAERWRSPAGQRSARPWDRNVRHDLTAERWARLYRAHLYSMASQSLPTSMEAVCHARHLAATYRTALQVRRTTNRTAGLPTFPAPDSRRRRRRWLRIAWRQQRTRELTTESV